MIISDELKRFIDIINGEGCLNLIDDLKQGKVEAYELIDSAIKNNDFKVKEKDNLEVFYQDMKLMWGAFGLDLSDLDLSKIPTEKLLRIPFSTLTKWPTKDKLPKDFDPEKIINNANKHIGMGVEKLHENNINGLGTTIVYIDKPFNVNHCEFADQDIEYKTKSKKEDFHGSAVASRVIGKNSGIAKKAKLIYYGIDQNLIKDDFWSSIVEDALNALKDVVKRAKNNENIDVIGMSSSIEFQITHVENKNKREKYQADFEKVKKQLDNLNIPLIDSNAFFRNSFAYAFRINPKTSNNSENYLSRFSSKSVCVLEGGKTIPVPYADEGYQYENELGSASWSIPQVVGLYALAKQVDKKITFEDFARICKETAETNARGVNILNSTEMIKQVSCEKENRTGANI